MNESANTGSFPARNSRFTEGEGTLPNDGTEFRFLPHLEALLREFPTVLLPTWPRLIPTSEPPSY